jgi:hypothetical protein
MTSSSAPMILSLNGNIKTMGPNDTLIVSVIVTDPDGINDVIGGTLDDPDSGSSYGSFATSATEGAYTITLTWEAIQAVRSIDAPPGGAHRIFRAKFFDVAGNSTTGDLDILMDCGTSASNGYQYAICGGVCAPTCDPCPSGWLCGTTVAGRWDYCKDLGYNMVACVTFQDCQNLGMTNGTCEGGYCWGPCYCAPGYPGCL